MGMGRGAHMGRGQSHIPLSANAGQIKQAAQGCMSSIELLSSAPELQVGRVLTVSSSSYLLCRLSELLG